MVLFGKPDTLTSTMKKIKAGEFRNSIELNSWLIRIGAELDLKAKQIAWMVGHSRREVRAFAADKLSEMNDKDVVDLLLKEMEGKTASIRFEIAGLAMKLDPRKVYASLGRMLHSKDVDTRMSALDLIVASNDPLEYLSHLKAAIKDPDLSIREKTVKILCTKPDNPTAYLILRNLVHDEEDPIRRRVIEALSKSANPDIVEPFLERLPLEPPRVQSLMVQALIQLARNPLAKVEDKLLPMLADEKKIVRNSAVKLLKEIPNRVHVIRQFLLFSKGLAHWLRDRTYQSFSLMTHGLIDPIMELMEDENPEIRVGAMMLAADSSDPRVVPILRKIFLGNDDWWVRVLAADQLAKFPRSDVTDTLISKINDPDLRYSIVAALGVIDSPAVIPPLLICLNDPQRTIRMAVLDALENIHYPEVADAVAQVAIGDTEDEVRDKALLTLEAMGTAGAERMQAVLNIQKDTALASLNGLDQELELEMVNPDLK